jgi:hypothetical protein
MRKEPASASRAVAVRRSPRTRSAVSNGRRLHVTKVGDTATSRRFRDLLAEIISDIGGSDGLSEGQRQLARRAATISLECEKLEAKAVSGEEIDVETYGRLTDRLGRAFGRLGLKRVALDATPTLESYIRQNYGDPGEETAVADPTDEETAAEPLAEARGTFVSEPGSETGPREKPTGESARRRGDSSP